MKKMNYVRPLAEVIELAAQDIIRTSISFSTDVSGGTDGGDGTYKVNAKNKPITYIDGGEIKLK